MNFVSKLQKKYKVVAKKRLVQAKLDVVSVDLSEYEVSWSGDVAKISGLGKMYPKLDDRDNHQHSEEWQGLPTTNGWVDFDKDGNDLILTCYDQVSDDDLLGVIDRFDRGYDSVGFEVLESKDL